MAGYNIGLLQQDLGQTDSKEEEQLIVQIDSSEWQISLSHLSSMLILISNVDRFDPTI